MRYLPIERLREGMVLGRGFYGNKFEVLLGQGLKLSPSLIRKIGQMGYAGAYIEDAISQGIDARDLLPDEDRLGTIRAAQELWQQAEQQQMNQQRGRNTKNVQNVQKDMNRVTMPVIEGLIENRQRMVDLIDLKPEEKYIYYHAASCVILSLLIGVEMGLSGVQLHELGIAAMLHDVGNIFIPKEILNKPDKLTPEEYKRIQSHTELGFEYLRDHFDISIEGCMGALHHHENYDGSGYPTGLKRDKISIYGRIIAIADVYDALTSRRPFRNMLYPPAAMAYLSEKAGSMFDPEIVETFQKVVALYPSGTCVELDTGEQGIVTRNIVGHPTRPMLRLIEQGKPVGEIDLQADPKYHGVHITQIIEL